MKNPEPKEKLENIRPIEKIKVNEKTGQVIYEWVVSKSWNHSSGAIFSTRMEDPWIMKNFMKANNTRFLFRLRRELEELGYKVTNHSLTRNGMTTNKYRLTFDNADDFVKFTMEYSA